MDNLRGIFLMTAAMAGFAINDGLLKVLTGYLPVAWVVFFMGLGGFAIYGGAVLATGGSLLTRDWLRPAVLLRNGAEAVATVSFITAMSLIPLSTASAILQANPLFVTLGAALFLAETVGWRRWLAIGAGFFGMVLILRPGSAGLNWGAMLAVLAMVMLAVRDLSTRVMPKSLSTLNIAAYAFAVLIPTGALMLLTGIGTEARGATQTGIVWPAVLMLATLLSATGAYYCVTAAMRVGEVAAVTPFRYSRLIFTMSIGIFLLGERPDALTFLGAGIIIAGGLYTVYRERIRRSAAPLS